MIEDLIKPNIKALKAYAIEAQPCSIRLDANESPYGFPLEMPAVQTNRYPDPDAVSLREFLSSYYTVEPECILLGNGSDELISYLLTAVGGPVVIPSPTFSMYRIIAESLGEQYLMVPLDEQFDLDMEAMLGAIEKENPKLIFLSRPNNPTGNSFKFGKVVEIIEKSRGLVVVDEAYQPFSPRGDSFIDLLPRYKNLLVMRTLSKIGMAALRLGFLLGDKTLIEAINKVRLPYNVNSLSQAAALEILEDEQAINTCINNVMDERDKLFSELLKLKGIRAYPSDANFILFKLDMYSPLTAGALHKRLIADDILIKKLAGGGPLHNCFRVTVGTPKENAAFITSLKKIIEETNK
ncbi:histidinol-phosphate transaminase [Candidatus Magnetominusculus dajiuhuensis]|uniref:histidinol-phosphate transaminase n=1 Tax=Candidatus Magnetominusculus dajiuhuensis TaxID=3137712 RepID=UPI003B42AB42